MVVIPDFNLFAMPQLTWGREGKGDSQLRIEFRSDGMIMSKTPFLF